MENQSPYQKRQGIATARQGLKGGRFDHSPFCPKHARNSSQTLNMPRRRPRPNMNDGEVESEDFGYHQENFDETDRCSTTLSSLEKDEESLEAFYKGPCAQCELDRQPPHLYPDLEPLDFHPVVPLKDPPREGPPCDSEKIPRYRHGPTPIISIAMGILLIASLVGLYYLFGKGPVAQEQDGGPSPLEKIHTKILNGLKGLRGQTQQERHFWIQVLSQLELLSEESPDQPAVLLGLTTSAAQGAATAACLSQEIANIVSGAFEDSSAIMFDTQSILFSSRNGSAFKEKLDGTMQGLRDSHAVAVHNLERIPPSAVMLFHAYCDTENAPFKRALIILTVEVDMEYSSLAENNLDLSAYNRLMELWSPDLREEDASAIVSRVAKAPVLFRPEAFSIIHRLCPH